MKKINLKGISEILSEKEMKNVMGGSDGYRKACEWADSCNGTIQMCSSGSISGYCKRDGNGNCACLP